eukprot:COSAG05_NODE_5956_length_1051_cov_1.345588_2_plen_196_part_00
MCCNLLHRPSGLGTGNPVLDLGQISSPVENPPCVRVRLGRDHSCTYTTAGAGHSPPSGLTSHYCYDRFLPTLTLKLDSAWGQSVTLARWALLGGPPARGLAAAQKVGAGNLVGLIYCRSTVDLPSHGAPYQTGLLTRTIYLRSNQISPCLTPITAGRCRRSSTEPFPIPPRPLLLRAGWCNRESQGDREGEQVSR